jgi:TolA-binding protein
VTPRSFLKALLPVALLATGGCLATRSDIERLELTIRAMADTSRAREARSDSATRALINQTAQVLAAQFTRDFNVVSDSVKQVSTALQRLQGDVQLSVHDLKAQMSTLQEGLGQSQRRLENLRNSVESSASAPARPADPGASTVAPGTPSAAQLLKTGKEQVIRGAAGTARMSLQLLIDSYPTDDRAAEAQLQIGESYATEGNKAAADSAYALVVQKYPANDWSATALWKRAKFAEQVKDSTRARVFYRQIIDKYPKSNEKILAEDALNPPKRP